MLLNSHDMEEDLSLDFSSFSHSLVLFLLLPTLEIITQRLRDIWMHVDAIISMCGGPGKFEFDFRIWIGEGFEVRRNDKI